MDREELIGIINVYGDIFNTEKLKEYALIIAENVERETRHRCVSEAFDLANRLANRKFKERLI